MMCFAERVGRQKDEKHCYLKMKRKFEVAYLLKKLWFWSSWNRQKDIEIDDVRHTTHIFIYYCHPQRHPKLERTPNIDSLQLALE